MPVFSKENLWSAVATQAEQASSIATLANSESQPSISLNTTSQPKSPISPALLIPPALKLVKTEIPEVQQTETTQLPAVIQLQETIAVESPCVRSGAVQKGFPKNLPSTLNLVLGQDGKAYARLVRGNNPSVLPVGSRQLDNIIREHAYEENVSLRKHDLSDINSMLQAHAEMAGIKMNVWNRIAPISDGIEIDLGDDNHTRIRITTGKVEVLESGSESLFFRSPISLPMVMPAESGDLSLLKKYLNLHPIDATLLVGWTTYTIAHPKMSTSKFPPLVLIGGEGKGKSFLCHLISTLIDSNRVVLQKLPSNDKDLAIAAQCGHVACFDNIRHITPAMSDNLCIAATGGVLTSRQLYSDAEMAVLNLHCAIILNGIHAFITQQDLAQRCLTIHPQPIAEENRKSETLLMQEFQADLPYIMRGLYDLIATIFMHYKDVTPTNPERMIDFSRWLAAMELAQNVPAGVYQAVYSESLRNGRLDGLQEDELGAAMLEYAEELDGESWHGTPAELLNILSSRVSKGMLYAKEWPKNAISLSKKLAVLQAGLKSQGIDVAFGRGKKRSITINTIQSN